MKRMTLALISLAALVFTPLLQAEISLPSWQSNETKTTIINFVESVTKEGSDSFVAPSQRIAVFDNDGTLWSEQPAYFQLFFAMDRVKAMAPQHPQWKTTQPFQAVLEGDMEALTAGGEKGLLQLIGSTHAGMNTDEFTQIVKQWTTTAKHPTTGRLYTEMVYQPMLEILEYLRANGFKTYIVSGGGIEFMRPWTEAVYDIPPEQVIGSSIKTQFVMTEDGPVLERLPQIDFIDDKEGKPVGIHSHIGQRPIMAFGNSDGDLQMLQWSTAGKGKSLAVIVHHTDAEREWAYDRNSHIGKLDKAMDMARDNGWLIVDMKRDWMTIYPAIDE